jgi:DNA-binding LacI/PurR family transcriptional regulator
MPVTLADVAELAGVSRSAVSRTFTPGASVSDNTRRKVEAAAKKLGYRPNMIARSLSTKRTHLVGLVCNNFHNPYLMEVFEYFTEQLQANHLRPLLVNLSGDTDPQESINLLHQYRVDAVIVASSTLPTNFTLSFKQAGIPCIHVFGRSADEPEVNIVGINNRMGGQLAATSLIERGYQQIAFLGGPAEATSTKDRETGFRLTLQEHNREIVCACHTERYAYDDGYYTMQKLLEQYQFDGLFCGDDVITMGAITAAREHGINIPQELGIIGFNDMAMAKWPGMEFSTIRQPTKDIAKSAVELLLAMLKEPDRIAEARIFSCNLIDRGTLRPIPEKNQ